jgi:hypothetical protein
MVIIPTSRPQMVYTTPIMTTQTNKSMGWPPPIPINCEGQRTGGGESYSKGSNGQAISISSKVSKLQ